MLTNQHIESLMAVFDAAFEVTLNRRRVVKKRLAILFPYLIFLFSPALNVMALDIPEGQSRSNQEAQIPLGQSKKENLPTNQRTGSEIFGTKGGYIHPFLIVEERYTDNLYYTKSDKEDDWITTISPESGLRCLLIEKSC